MKNEESSVMKLRHPQFFTLNFSLLTSLSRTLLLLAMAWAVVASAADGEGKWKQLLDTKLVDEWQPIFIDAYVDPEHGRPPRPAETLAQKMIAFEKVIAKSTGGQTVPIYLSPEAATVQYPKQEKPRGVHIMMTIVSVSLRDTLRYVTDISGVRFKITDEGILIFVPPKPADKAARTAPKPNAKGMSKRSAVSEGRGFGAELPVELRSRY